jgi:hypothetical protein
VPLLVSLIACLLMIRLHDTGWDASKSEAVLGR